jgi:predicted SnoaL-like aldol condensation-catalyzing enzyme
MANAISETHSQAAVQFLKLVTSGRIDEAYQRYVDMKGKHHNCYFPAGLPALKKAMIDNHKTSPVKQYTVKNVIGEGNMVALHAHLSLNQSDNGMVVVHLFRFEGDKIVEFWDCGQVIPADMPNKDGAF